MKISPLHSSISLGLTNFFKQEAVQYHIEMVFLYGSRASGQSRSDSDIDLAILFSEGIDNQDKIFFLLTEITYKLTRELKKEVNIISISCDFNHPMLYYNAIVSGIPVFIKDYDNLLNFKLEAIHQMEDFQIYGVIWQKEIAKKLMREVTGARI